MGSRFREDNTSDVPSTATWSPQPEPTDPLQYEMPKPNFRDSRMSERDQLRHMNEMAARFWRTR
jgi:hypothetical protein